MECTRPELMQRHRIGARIYGLRTVFESICLISKSHSATRVRNPVAVLVKRVRGNTGLYR
jgi:hypothetical protein